MSLKTVLLAFAVVFALAAAEDAPDGWDTTKSTDQLHLTFIPHTGAKLNGIAGTTHRLQLNFKNGGAERGGFVVNVMSSNPEFAGDYPKFLDVDSNEQRTIDITGLEVPSDAQDGTIYKITVNVKRGSLDGGMSSASMYGVDLVQTVMLFTVGGPPTDTTKPEVQADYGEDCTVMANDTMCDQHQWYMTFDVQDEESGLNSVSVRGMGRESLQYRVGRDVFFSHPNFEIGTKDEIEVRADVSCCIRSISLRAVDLAGVESDSEYGQNGSGSFSAALAASTLALVSFLVTRSMH
jgi:hypothetical protein